MTTFEEFAEELGVQLTIDDHGLYTGMARVLANICTQVIMDDPTPDGCDWEELKPIILEKFYSKFPYMQK